MWCWTINFIVKIKKNIFLRFYLQVDLVLEQTSFIYKHHVSSSGISQGFQNKPVATNYESCNFDILIMINSEHYGSCMMVRNNKFAKSETILFKNFLKKNMDKQRWHWNRAFLTTNGSKFFSFSNEILELVAIFLYSTFFSRVGLYDLLSKSFIKSTLTLLKISITNCKFMPAYC